VGRRQTFDGTGTSSLDMVGVRAGHHHINGVLRCERVRNEGGDAAPARPAGRRPTEGLGADKREGAAPFRVNACAMISARTMLYLFLAGAAGTSSQS